jgi:hypothetical protein
MPVMLVLFTIVFWAIARANRDTISRLVRREKLAMPDKSQINLLAIVGIVGTFAAWVILGLIWYFSRNR